MRLCIYILTLLCVAAGTIFSSCESRGAMHAKPHWFKTYSVFNGHDYADFIRLKMNGSPDSSLFFKMERNFYAGRNFEPFWTWEGLQEQNVDELLSFFNEAPKHGISPEFFDYSSFTANINSLKSGKVPNDTTLYAFLFELEHGLTSNYLKYASAMNFGAVNPKEVHGRKWYYEMLGPDSAFVSALLESIDGFQEKLRELQPSSDEYRALQASLERFRALENDSLAKASVSNIAKNRDKGGHLHDIWRILSTLGYNTGNEQNTLSDSLLSSINAFRKANNMPEGDNLDSATTARLAHPDEYIRKISANLERMRWKYKRNKADDTICIVVNIPDFQYFVMQNDSVVISKKICCGRTQNPKGRPERYKNGIALPFKSETPLMFSYITSLTLNPEWNIPYDIIKNEYYPKLVKSNTACIQREHIYIKDSRTGGYVHPETIDWSKVPRSNIPYRLHQTSGAYNALGRVKFVFANSESVYLHDTNNKGAFGRRRRALSHGCVRVEHPLELAEWVYKVNEFDTNYIERIHIIMGEQPKTEKGEKYLEEKEKKEAEYYESLNDYDKQFYRKLRPTSISLKKRIPLFIEYRTCYVDRDGGVQYRDDVYYKDDNIFRILNPGSDL